MIIIKSDYSEAYKEFDRLEKMPDGGMVKRLDAALKFGFETTRAKVHVQTGALKGTGKADSSVKPSRWDGKFSFGDKAKKVDYAIYEKARGDTHDFFLGIHALTGVFVAAIKEGLRKKR